MKKLFITLSLSFFQAFNEPKVEEGETVDNIRYTIFRNTYKMWETKDHFIQRKSFFVSNNSFLWTTEKKRENSSRGIFSEWLIMSKAKYGNGKYRKEEKEKKMDAKTPVMFEHRIRMATLRERRKKELNWVFIRVDRLLLRASSPVQYLFSSLCKICFYHNALYLVTIRICR